MSIRHTLATATEQGRALFAPGGALAPIGQAANERVWPLLLRKMAVNLIGFVRRSGLKITELQRGRVVCEMPLKGNANHLGTMYAGALFTLAEFPGGALFAASFDWRRQVPIVSEVTLQFLRPARGKVILEVGLSEVEMARIERELAQQGKAGFVLDGELKTADGTLVARSHAAYQIRPKR